LLRHGKESVRSTLRQKNKLNPCFEALLIDLFEFAIGFSQSIKLYARKSTHHVVERDALVASPCKPDGKHVICALLHPETTLRAVFKAQTETSLMVVFSEYVFFFLLDHHGHDTREGDRRRISCLAHLFSRNKRLIIDLLYDFGGSLGFRQQLIIQSIVHTQSCELISPR
jgi:hypothetical protein